MACFEGDFAPKQYPHSFRHKTTTSTHVFLLKHVNKSAQSTN